jgi:hypothetical protein
MKAESTNKSFYKKATQDGLVGAPAEAATPAASPTSRTRLFRLRWALGVVGFASLTVLAPLAIGSSIFWYLLIPPVVLMAVIPSDPTTRTWWRRLRRALGAIFTTCLIVAFALMTTYPWIAWYFLIPPGLIFLLVYEPRRFLRECGWARERRQEMRETHPGPASYKPGSSEPGISVNPSPPNLLDEPSGSIGRPIG